MWEQPSHTVYLKCIIDSLQPLSEVESNINDKDYSYFGETVEWRKNLCVSVRGNAGLKGGQAEDAKASVLGKVHKLIFQCEEGSCDFGAHVCDVSINYCGSWWQQTHISSRVCAPYAQVSLYFRSVHNKPFKYTSVKL